MYECNICEKEFKFLCLLNRHLEANKICRESIAFMNTITGLEKNIKTLKKTEKKYNELKELSNQIFDEKTLLEKKNKELKFKYRTELLKLKHRAELAETKCELYEKLIGTVMNNSVINNNSHNKTNTIINNNTIIQDLSIKSVLDTNTSELAETTDKEC